MKKTAATHLIVIAAVGLAVYSNTFRVPFIFDDAVQMEGNPLLTYLGLSPKTSFLSFYNPRRVIGYLTFALNYRLGGLETAGYHAVNLAVHLMAAFLVYALVRLTIRTPRCMIDVPEPEGPARFRSFSFDGGAGLALAAALFFVSHPVQTQAVTYIVQRFASLAALLYLLSLVAYASGRLLMQLGSSPSSATHLGGLKPSGARSLSIGAFFAVSFASAVLAMLTKEIAFTLPLVVVLYEFLFFKVSFRKRVLLLLPLLATLAIIPIGIMGSHKPIGRLFSDIMQGTKVQSDMGRLDYLMTQMRVIVTYLRLVLLPVNQNLDYDYPVFHSLFAAPVTLSFILLFAVAATGVCLLVKGRQGTAHAAASADRAGLSRAGTYRLIGFGLLWFFIALSVTSSVVPIRDVIFEHRLYLPSVGLCIAAAAGLHLLRESARPAGSLARRFVPVVAFLLIFLFSAATYARNAVWKDRTTLWEDVVKKSPDKTRAHYNLGAAYGDEGYIKDAVREYERAVALNPRDIDTRNNLGNAYASLGRMEESVAQYKAAIAVAPTVAITHYNLAKTYEEMGRTDDALREYRAALSLDPDIADAHNNIGAILAGQGRDREAADELRTALKLRPDFPEARKNLEILMRRTHESAAGG